MRVTKVGNLYRASRITGPKNNYLGLVLDKSPGEMAIVRRAIGNEVATIDEARLVEAVVGGLSDFCAALENVWHTRTIEYVPSDTPDYAAYRLLAQAIAERACTEND